MDVPAPTKSPRDILVGVHAAGLNPVDFKFRQGKLRAILRPNLPFVLGNELAGEVIAVGSDVTRFRVGDRVFARVLPALMPPMPWPITTAGCGPSPLGRYSQASSSSPEAVGIRTVVRGGAAALSFEFVIVGPSLLSRRRCWDVLIEASKEGAVSAARATASNTATRGRTPGQWLDNARSGAFSSQPIVGVTPPSTRSAAPLVAEDSGLAR